MGDQGQVGSRKLFHVALQLASHPTIERRGLLPDDDRRFGSATFGQEPVLGRPTRTCVERRPRAG